MSTDSFHYAQPCLQNDLVRLEAFDPEFHVAPLLKVIKATPDMLTYTSFPESDTFDEFMTDLYNEIQSSPKECFYAVIDKSAKEEPDNSIEGRYAGILSLSGADPYNAAIEIGAIIFPKFQHTHVAKVAIGLALMYTLDPPRLGGLGLRRIEWRCHSENIASRRIALRMGFELEGVLRWHRVCTRATDALATDRLEKQNGTQGEMPGRHTAVFSIVWDEWAQKRVNVIAQMNAKKSTSATSS